MNSALRIQSAGFGVTIQDGGRSGFLRFGVTAAGPMDPLAHAMANRAVAAAPDAAAIEIPFGGLEVVAEYGPATVALAGGRFDIRIDGAPLPAAVVARLAAGSTLSVRGGKVGMWCYLALAGTMEVPPVMGSTATHTRSGIGGMAGRGLAPGDLIPLTLSGADVAEGEILAPHLDDNGRSPVRVMVGPQADHFSPRERERFLCQTWTISGRSDRMGYRLDGKPLRYARSFNIVSDGIAMGSVQVPGDGLPIVLMADRQPTGGYPKIATVISADLGVLAQRRPGSEVRFVEVSHEEAVAALRVHRAAIGAAPIIMPIVRTDFTSEFLLGVNLVGGVVSAASLNSGQGKETEEL